MSYTRLTKRTKGGTPYIISDCEDTKKCKSLCLDYDCPVARVVERLAELEDKIEQRTMIELPCKVGTIVYYVASYENKIGYSKKKKYYCEIMEFPFTLEMLDTYGNNWFLSREDA